MIKDTRSRLRVLIWIGIGASLLFTYLRSTELGSKLNISQTAFVEMAIFFCLFLFEKWLWKLPPFTWIFDTRPIISGTWKGYVQSANNKAKVNVGEKLDAYLVVRQSFTSVHVRFYTQESYSYSSSSQLIKKPDDEVAELHYTFVSKPKMAVKHRSPMKYGAAVFMFDSLSPDSLEGSYWTDIDSSGDMKFTKRTSKLATSYDNATQRFTS